MKWQFAKAGYANDCELFWVNIFDYEWKDTGKTAEVRDPLHNERKVMKVYTAELRGKTVTFAAGEFSNGIYGFYIPEDD